jgi:hypothetical protein
VTPLSPATSLSESGFDIPACTGAFEWLPQYASFRRHHPVSDYWNPGDPLYDLPFAPPESPRIIVALTTYLSVPFGLAVEQLEKSCDRESKVGLTALFDSLRKRIELAVSPHGLLPHCYLLWRAVPKHCGEGFRADAISGLGFATRVRSPAGLDSGTILDFTRKHGSGNRRLRRIEDPK